MLIFFILGALLFLAILWEYQDHHRLANRKSVQSLETASDQKREYLFYGCYNYENNVAWRGIFIGSVLATLIIWYILYAMKVKVRWWVVLLIFFAVFIPFYAISTFKTFHLYRVMCNKLKTDLTIL